MTTVAPQQPPLSEAETKRLMTRLSKAKTGLGL